MTEEELILSLLCSRMGDRILPLTVGQYRSLRGKAGKPLTETPEILSLCASEQEKDRIEGLLERKESVLARLESWEACGVSVCTLLSGDYPEPLLRKLGDDAPAVLFLSGNRGLLAGPALSLVGCRNLREENRLFARERGARCAARGLALCSGDARGADRAGQDGCLEAGGAVLSFVSDRLLDRTGSERHLYISEDSPDAPFSTPRALSRNRLIHCMGACVFVAQTEDGRGGTWSGTYRNLTHRWTPVYYYEDGSAGAEHLRREGAKPFSDYREEA